MKKYVLLLLLMAVGLSSGVYGQGINIKKLKSKTKHGLIEPFTPPGVSENSPFLPRRDTVIMIGEEIEVGAYLCEVSCKRVEIVGYGNSKKSHLKKVDGFEYKKGTYFIKVKPKQTTTYEFIWTDDVGWQLRHGRIVYVAKTAEEKKQMEEMLNAKLGPKGFTTYRYTPQGEEPIKITGTSSRTLK